MCFDFQDAEKGRERKGQPAAVVERPNGFRGIALSVHNRIDNAKPAATIVGVTGWLSPVGGEPRLTFL
jgi:hypothetical protein